MKRKLFLSIAAIGAVATPIAGVIACNSNSGVKSVVSSADIKEDAKFNELLTKYTGFSKERIRILGHKQEVQKQTEAAIKSFNEAFGTNLVIEQIGGTQQYSAVLANRFQNANDIGLVQFELEGEAQALGSYGESLKASDFGASGTGVEFKFGTLTTTASTSESLGVIYNKDVFAKAGITVHEGMEDSSAVDGLEKVDGKITDVYTDGLTKQGYTELANAINAIDGVDGFYSTTKSGTGNIWPYTNHLLSSAIKNQGTVPKDSAATGDQVITDGVQSNIEDAIDIYSIGNNIPTNTVENAMGKLASNAVGMSQNGTWAMTQITKTNPNAKIGFLPMPIFEKSGDKTALFMKGITQKWALTTGDQAKKKTIMLFLNWMYGTQTGIDSLYGDFASETPYTLPTGVVPKSDNALLVSAAKYQGDDVLLGELALSALPAGFNNDSSVLTEAMNNDFASDQLSKVRSEYDRLNTKKSANN